MRRRFLLLTPLLAVASVSGAVTRERIVLPSVPKPLPDGKSFVFTWHGDIWHASVDGGTATRLTRHAAEDHWPCVSPDGRRVAFVSKRDSARSLYVVPIEGGTPEQITHHTEGCTPLVWFPDGKSVLVRATRDHAGRRALRLFRVYLDRPGPEELLFDAYGYDADISPDGNRVLFTRGSAQLYRKGYRGSKASQIWSYDTRTGEYALVRKEPGGCRSPLWQPDGKGFYYVSQESGCFNVWSIDLESGRAKQLTHFEDASVIIPGLSRNGKTMVFRQLFDFYSFDPRKTKHPKKLELWATGDMGREVVRRRWYSNVWNNDVDGSLDFTDDGLQMCFTAGGDLWVMDTVLRDPRPVTSGGGWHETEAVFTRDAESILFLRDAGDRVDVWEARRGDPERHWWDNRTFDLRQVTTDGAVKDGLSVSPDGTRMAYCVGRAEIVVSSLDGHHRTTAAKGAGRARYDWAPDGRWLVCELGDSNRDRDIWIVSADGARAPYNLSRHPASDHTPRWSPDGRMIAFVGQGDGATTGLCYAHLRLADHRATKHDRSYEKALSTMRSAAKKRPKPEPPKPPAPAEEAQGQEKKKAPPEPEKPKIPPVVIDFEELCERVSWIEVKGSAPTHLLWSHDSKTLAFHTTINDKKGTYKVVFPDKLKPAFMTDKRGTQARWVKEKGRILWLLDRLPAHYTTKFEFKAFQHTDLADYRRLTFRLIWRTMRDRFYDGALNGLNWEAVRRKYEGTAAQAIDRDVFDKTVAMLLGELNASHVGFSHNSTSEKEWKQEWSDRGWTARTGHTGLRFDRAFPGPGLRVRDVIPGGPTDRDRSRVRVGETLVKINGVPVDRTTDLAPLLSGVYPRDDLLVVADAKGRERTVVVRTISYSEARTLLRDWEIRKTRKKVDELSNGSLGYLHIAKMQWDDLRKFEREVFARGVGREGLVVDVRGNTGGFVADRLLDVLCHPVHAITVPRGGEPSYPADYLGRAVWNKPIVVLCDQGTVSNGEIFCHAVKGMGRGKIVGAPTQGGVIATGSVSILDMGKLRVPERGWFVSGTGQDMELNGCVPDVVIWPKPGELPAGVDTQLAKAVELLLEDVAAAKTAGKPTLQTATERRRLQQAAPAGE